MLPPASFDAAKPYALVVSLHGATGEVIGQVGAYSAKDWTYIIAPTNQQPFGFDWEEFGRVDALEVLDHAVASYKIAADRVYLTGHSMGGHHPFTSRSGLPDYAVWSAAGLATAGFFTSDWTYPAK